MWGNPSCLNTFASTVHAVFWFISSNAVSWKCTFVLVLFSSVWEKKVLFRTHRWNLWITPGFYLEPKRVQLWEQMKTLSEHKIQNISYRKGQRFILCGPYYSVIFILTFLISPLFHQLGHLRTSSHLQLQPGQDKAKQCGTNNITEFHME
jgi:hypothetical protein